MLETLKNKSPCSLLEGPIWLSVTQGDFQFRRATSQGLNSTEPSLGALERLQETFSGQCLVISGQESDAKHAARNGNICFGH